MAWANALHIPGESWAVATFLALATNVALLKLVAYAVDRRRGAVAVSLERFLAELLFFPTLPAGPLRSVAAARDEAVTGMPSGAVVLASLGRLTLGWLKCVLPPLFLVIDTMEIFTTQGAAFGRLRLWLYVGEVAALFTLLVSGWSDVAIALGRLVGTAPPENMRHPWRAPSVAEFWRRWHATLWAWWHAYVYVPLGGSERAAARNVGIVFLLSAVWHAWGISKILGWAGYPPSAWGAMLLCAGLNAGGVVASHVLDRRGPADGGPVTAVRALLTGTFVALAWLPMFLTTMTDLGGVYLRLFGLR
jgi:D-alanyl-lipoteichoic acid acyltransferase DltB (MBOAT superfamily)